MIFYDKRSGIIDAVVPSIDYSYHYPTDIKSNLVWLEVEEYPEDIFKHRVINGTLVRMSDVELNELHVYERLLTEDERVEEQLLQKIKPSYKEVQKAEETLRLLELLQEVM